MVSVVIPAHNEGRVISRLLGALTRGAAPGEVEVVVVCNGCSDDTAEVAGRFAPQVRVIETPVPSKHAALRLGDQHVSAFPRLYVDADVELGLDDVRRLARALERPGVLAAGPTRVVPTQRCPWPVRWYYAFWQELPQVRSALFGRGVLAVNQEGHRRIGSIPPVMADDLAVALHFSPQERIIVPDAHVVVHPPMSWGDLIRRRTRAVTGTEQLRRQASPGAGHRSEGPPTSPARTSVRDLGEVVRRDPRQAFRLPVFLAVTLLARRGARRAVAVGDWSTWLRDESSRG